MAEPSEIWYCHGCGRVSETKNGLLEQGCEGIHQHFISADITLDLLASLMLVRDGGPEESWVEKGIIANNAIKKFREKLQNGE